MITVSKIENDCQPCKRRNAVSTGRKHAGLLTTILLIVLPKCPFCLMAFSSTIILCGKAGGASGLTHSSSTTIFITAFFCCAVLLNIIFNYRDKRTMYSFLLAAAGCFFIMYSVCAGGGLPLYYSGVTLVFFGVWLNASLLYIVRKIRGNRREISEDLKDHSVI